MDDERGIFRARKAINIPFIGSVILDIPISPEITLKASVHPVRGRSVHGVFI